jgi:hypothetical protein
LWGEFSISQLLLSSWNTKVPTLPSLQGNDKEARKEKKKASRILQRSTAERAEAGVSDGPWSATRLSVTLSRTFKLSFGTETNIQMWRHAAIAINIDIYSKLSSRRTSLRQFHGRGTMRWQLTRLG